jgi:hypothetical protein
MKDNKEKILDIYLLNFMQHDYQLETMLTEINRKQIELIASLENIKQQYAETVKQHDKQFAQLQLIKNTINQRKKMHQNFIDKYHFDGYENIKLSQLNALTDNQLKYILFRKTKNINVDSNFLKREISFSNPNSNIVGNGSCDSKTNIRLNETQIEIPNEEVELRENIIKFLKSNGSQDDSIFPELANKKTPYNIFTSNAFSFSGEYGSDFRNNCTKEISPTVMNYAAVAKSEPLSSRKENVLAANKNEPIGLAEETSCENIVVSRKKRPILCKYCHTNYHHLGRCPVLASRTCGNCGKKGHSKLYCRADPSSVKNATV